jgi:nucleoside-diphosphate-sugar epimerase
MRIFVTGGSGFLGSRMIRTLVNQGHEVFALARSTSSGEQVRTLGATPITGDLEKSEQLSLPEIEAVVHAAAYFRFAGPRAPYFRANVEGTRALLTVARKAGAATFIYVSAGGVVMDDRGSFIRDADESAPTFPNSFSGYIATPAIWGPGDPFSRALPDAIASGTFAFIERGDYPFAICHVDNVIEAVQCALKRGTGGHAYFIKDRETTSFRDFIAMLADRRDCPSGG